MDIMVLEVLVGLALGLGVTKIHDYLQLEQSMIAVVVIAAIVILGLLGLVTWLFLSCFVVGVWLYKNYLENMW